MKWPWERWREAELEAEKAERDRDRAKQEHASVERLAAESRRISKANGFTDAIRAAMGVQR